MRKTKSSSRSLYQWGEPTVYDKGSIMHSKIKLARKKGLLKPSMLKPIPAEYHIVRHSYGKGIHEQSPASKVVMHKKKNLTVIADMGKNHPGKIIKAKINSSKNTDGVPVQHVMNFLSMYLSFDSYTAIRILGYYLIGPSTIYIKYEVDDDYDVSVRRTSSSSRNSK